MASAWYCTREDVKAATDIKESARNNAQIDRAIDAASRAVEGLTHRRFYPELDTRYFDWPNYQYASSWRLWLDANEVIEVTSLTSGGEVVSSNDYFLEPNTYGPPYNSIEIDLSSSASFNSGSTRQRSIAVTGLFGYREDLSNATTLAASASNVTTSLTVASSNPLGVGSILKIEDEYLIVTDKLMADTTQNLQTPLTAVNNDTLVSVVDGSVFAPGDAILLDSERMLVVDVAGNSLVVKRAWDGTTLASHTGSDVYAQWTLRVERGALGSIAASHADDSVVQEFEVPGLIKNLTVAEALNMILQESGGYARSTGTESNEATYIGRGIEAIRNQVRQTYGRKARIRGV